MSMVLSACSERESIAEITVSFNAGGGTAVKEVYNGYVESFPISKKDGYYIENWYTDEEKTNRAVFPFRAGESCTLYAKWVSRVSGNEEITYVKNDKGTAYIAERYKGYAYSVCVPDIHNGFPVVGVSDYFLEKKNYVNFIYIGKRVADIGNAFTRCSSLTEFEVNPDNTNYATEDGILYSKNLTRLYSYPSARKSESFTLNAVSEEKAFYLCDNLKELHFGRNGYIPESGLADMVAIESYTANQENGYYSSEKGILYSKDMKILIRCPVVTGNAPVKINDTTESVAENAFLKSDVKEIVLGKNVNSYNDFSEVPYLECYKVEKDNVNFTADTGVLYSADGKNLLRFPCGISGEYRVKAGVETIMDFAFSESKEITVINLPSSVKTIENCAFYGCEKLKSVICDENSLLSNIAGNAFSRCSRLEKIALTSVRPPQTETDIFSASDKAVTLFVPKNAGDMYKDLWKGINAQITPDGFPLTEYTTTFVANGEIFYSQHGVYVSGVPTLPQKEGYVFEGWYDNEHCVGEKLQFPYVAVEHVTFYAFFEEYIDMGESESE